jgi:hypothetical protein
MTGPLVATTEFTAAPVRPLDLRLPVNVSPIHVIQLTA